MLNDDLIDLYVLYNEQKQVKEALKDMKKALGEINIELDEIKTRILQELRNINHKFAKYKNMNVSINVKTKHAKLSSDELYKILENVVDADIDTEEKCKQILQATKSRPIIGQEQALKIKLDKV